ncbi:hypothetical protein D3C76_439910 [compost metagenome]
MKFPRRQHGAVLLVALVILLVLTTLTVTSMRGTTLEHRLVGNQGEERHAFNAGESALREGERQLARQTGEDDGRGSICNAEMILCVLGKDQVLSSIGDVIAWRWLSAPEKWWQNAEHAKALQSSDGDVLFSPAPMLNAAWFASDSGSSLNIDNQGGGVHTDFYYVTTYAIADAGRTPLILQSVTARRYSK